MHITNLKDLLRVSKINCYCRIYQKVLLQRYTSLAIQTLSYQKKYLRSTLSKSKGVYSAESLQAHKTLAAELLPESGLSFLLKFGKRGCGEKSIYVLSDFL